ncbi:MAG: chemotaxis protein CheW [Thermodesulfovibrionales bacterium]
MAKNLQFVVFSIGKEFYGVGIEAVQEIVRVPEITEVPDAPVFLEGVINLRGKIVPVIDLRKRFRLKGREKTRSTRVLIADNSGSLVGLLVDTVSEVLKIQPEAIEEPPQMISAVGVEYITGVAKMDAGLIIILDLKHVLRIEEITKAGNSLEEGGAARAA